MRALLNTKPQCYPLNRTSHCNIQPFLDEKITTRVTITNRTSGRRQTEIYVRGPVVPQIWPWQLPSTASLYLTNYTRREGVWGSGCIDPRFLDLDTSWRWVVGLTTLPLHPRGKSPRYPLDMRLGGPQNRYGPRKEEKILDTTGTRTLTPSAVQPVASRYTDYVIPTHLQDYCKSLFTNHYSHLTLNSLSYLPLR
jgi:hypothetical protein